MALLVVVSGGDVVRCQMDEAVEGTGTHLVKDKKKNRNRFIEAREPS